MGWYFGPYSKKQLIADLTVNDITREREFDGIRIVTECKAHCYRGNNFSGVLWTVWERTYTEMGYKCFLPVSENPVIKGMPVKFPQVHRWIGCDLLQYHKGTDGWGYKPLEESCGPYYWSCPLGYLTMVPEVSTDELVAAGINQEWRAGVREYHAIALVKRRANRARKLAMAN